MKTSPIVTLDLVQVRVMVMTAIHDIAAALHKPEPANADDLASLVSLAQEEQWLNGHLFGHVEELDQAGFLAGLPSFPHCKHCAEELTIAGQTTQEAYLQSAIPWFAYLTSTDDTPHPSHNSAVDIALDNELYAECRCGWRYRGSDAQDMEDKQNFHDPGDSCCNCGGMLCLQCVEGTQHAVCYRDCPDCCLEDVDGFTEMDRQRRMSRWWALTDQRELPETELRSYLAAFSAGHPDDIPALETEQEAMDYLHTLIDRYNVSTHHDED